MIDWLTDHFDHVDYGEDDEDWIDEHMFPTTIEEVEAEEKRQEMECAFDICECGDYRRDHPDGGPCNLNGLGHNIPDGWKCERFRFASLPTAEEMLEKLSTTRGAGVPCAVTTNP